MENIISEKSRKVEDPKMTGTSRNPRCAHCRNHGVQTTLKGHKAYCPYRSCNCGLCQLVRMRQKVMAKNVALRRRQELDKLKMQEILQAQKNHKQLTDSNGSPRFSDGEKSNSDLECETAVVTCPPEGNHISALALIILNFYNNDPKTAMDSIKKVAMELNSLITKDGSTSSEPNSCNKNEEQDIDMDNNSTGAHGPPLQNAGVLPSMIPNPKRVVLPTTPSLYFSAFNPFALKAYRPSLLQTFPAAAGNHVKNKKELVVDQCRTSKEEAKLHGHHHDLPFSIRSLTSEHTKMKSAARHSNADGGASEKDSEMPTIQSFYGMSGMSRAGGGMSAFGFADSHHHHQSFPSLPFPTFHGLSTAFWAKSWCKKESHFGDVVPSNSNHY